MLASFPRTSIRCLWSCQKASGWRKARRGAVNSSRLAAMALPSGNTFYLDNFAMRQWDDPNYPGTRITFDKEEFVAKVHEHYHGGSGLVDGYAPFCKHVFVPNFVGAKVGSVAITVDNQQSILTAYESRRPEELPVLARWMPSTKVDVPEAKMLDVILYSREQILKEKTSLPSEDKSDEIPDVPWGIISIKAQDEDFETPMQPITIMRNALGKEEGGSGVPIDREAYMKSVNYWRHRVPVLERD